MIIAYSEMAPIVGSPLRRAEAVDRNPGPRPLPEKQNSSWYLVRDSLGEVHAARGASAFRRRHGGYARDLGVAVPE
jgi:hypothetical protein